MYWQKRLDSPSKDEHLEKKIIEIRKDNQTMDIEESRYAEKTGATNKQRRRYKN